MIKLVAVDMDGTLLDNANKISEGNKAAILKMQEAGTEFLICTGRDYEDARAVVAKAGIHSNYICMSGASTFDESGKRLTSFPLSRIAVQDICHVFRQNCVYHDIVTNNGTYNIFTPEATKSHLYTNFIPAIKAMGKDTEEFKQRLELLLNKIHHIHSVEELLDDDSIDIYKISTLNPDRTLLAYMKAKLSSHPQLAVASTFPTNIEITDVKAQKGIALKAYIEQKGISMAEVMAIGDSENDYSMLSMDFGFTVAMENADEEIKAVSKYMTKSNVNDGVAWAINQFVLC